jgi:hypothetical protein
LVEGGDRDTHLVRLTKLSPVDQISEAADYVIAELKDDPDAVNVDPSPSWGLDA